MAYAFIAQVLLVLAVAVITGEIFEQFGLPSVAGELLSGIVMGPTILGIISENAQLEGLSSISLFFIIFLIGFEMDTETLKKHIGQGSLLTLTSFIIPFCAAFVVARALLGFDAAVTFIFALAVGVPSISIISVLVLQYNLLEKESGRIILSSVAVTDVVAFIMLATVSSPVPETIGVVLDTAVLIAAFVAVDWLLNLKPKAFRQAIEKVGRWAKREDMAYAALIVVGLAVAAAFQEIGLSYIIGAFFAGLIVHDGLIGRRPFQEVSVTFARMNRAFFIPFFFGFAGLEADLTSSSYGMLPALAAVVGISLSLAIGLSYYAGSRILKIAERGGAKRISVTLGGRGAVGIVVASVALGGGLINSEVYSLIVVGTLCISLVVPLLLGRKGVAG